jgi:hypothetical protein
MMIPIAIIPAIPVHSEIRTSMPGPTVFQCRDPHDIPSQRGLFLTLTAWLQAPARFVWSARFPFLVLLELLLAGLPLALLALELFFLLLTA